MNPRGALCFVLTVGCLWPAMLAGHHGDAVSSAQQIDPPRIVKRVEPVYPATAQRARIQGVVVLEATIGPDGKVRDAKVIQSIPELDEAALAAVRQWEYTPTIVKGVAQSVIMTVKLNFALSDPAAPPAGAPAPSAARNPTLAPMSAQVQREWETVAQAASKLALDEKASEAIAMIEKFLTRNPNIADAHYLLASAYETRSGFSSPPDAAQRRDLENAVKHYGRTGELIDDPAVRFLITWKLVRLHDADQLNDAAVAERYARRLVDEHPTRAEAYMEYARRLREKGDIAGAADVMRKGRLASTMPIPGLLLSLQYPIEQVQASRELSRDAARALLDESVAAADAILAHAQRDERDYRLATMGKAMALELQAERVAPDRQRRLALLVESERWGAPIAEHKNGVPPPPRVLSAAQATDLEWRALQRWNARLVDDGRMADAIKAYEGYLAEQPKFAPAHGALADLLIRAAGDETDTRLRTSRLEQAAERLQRVTELATAPAERDEAFSRLLNLYGPKHLNRPAQEEAVARAMMKRQPTAPAGHYALVTVLLRTGRSADAEAAMRAARTAIKPTAAGRAGMSSELVKTILVQEHLTPDSARRLFDEAGALLTEAEKLNINDLPVIEGRMSWLNLSAEKFEKDPARAAAQREQAKQLMARALAIRTKKMR